MGVKFLPIASSSKGNCTYVGSDDTNILIDCGISAKQTVQALEQSNIDIKNIDALFITHEHSDHIKGAGVLARKYKIPIYATTKTWDAIIKSDKLGKIDDRLICYVYKEEEFILNDIKILPFSVSHDAVDTVGYNIFIENKKISVCTDLGVVTENVKEKLSNSNVILIESNHDVKMVETGSYPYMLKTRILGHNGHLSNVSCGQLILSLEHDNLEHIFLGHLSEENNRPILALDTVKNILDCNNFNKNVKIKLADSHINKQLLNL